MSGKNKLVGFAVLSIVLVLAAGLVVSGCGGGAAPKPGKVYKVTFEASGGEPVPEAQLVEAGSKIELPKAMARTKFTFSGWYKDLDCKEPWDFAKDTVEGDIILFANWKPTAGKSGGGGGGGSSSSSGGPSGGGGTTYFAVDFKGHGGLPDTRTVNVASGTSLGSNVYPYPTNGSYPFFGWNTEENGTGTAFTSKTAVTSSMAVAGKVTLYAQWGPPECDPPRDGNTSGTAFLVSTPDALKYVGQGSSSDPDYYKRWDLGKYYELNEDIDMDRESFPQIGSLVGPFTGTFDGKGHTISNIDMIPDAPGEPLGLFGVNDGTIRNLGLDGGSTTTTSIWLNAGLVGFNYGIVENCYVIGMDITADSSAGALVGFNNGILRNCYAAENTIISSISSGIGGLVGLIASGTVQNCYITGSVSGDEYVGGVAGFFSGGDLINCVALMQTVKNNNTTNVGRVVGFYISGSMTNNYALETMVLTPALTLSPPGDPDDVHGKDVSLAEAADESWWRSTADWDSAWGGTSANETKPWKMGTVNGVSRPVLWYQ